MCSSLGPGFLCSPTQQTIVNVNIKSHVGKYSAGVKMQLGRNKDARCAPVAPRSRPGRAQVAPRSRPGRADIVASLCDLFLA